MNSKHKKEQGDTKKKVDEPGVSTMHINAHNIPNLFLSLAIPRRLCHLDEPQNAQIKPTSTP